MQTVPERYPIGNVACDGSISHIPDDGLSSYPIPGFFATKQSDGHSQPTVMHTRELLGLFAGGCWPSRPAARAARVLAPGTIPLYQTAKGEPARSEPVGRNLKYVSTAALHICSLHTPSRHGP